MPESGSAGLLASNHQPTPAKASSQSPSKQTAQNNISSNGIQPNTSDGSDNDQDQGKDEDDGADEADAEEDEGRMIAPSGGSGLGKGKRPAIRIDSVDMSREEDREAGSIQQDGLMTGPNKKRTFSSTSILSNLESHDGEDGQRDADYPRRKMARTLGEDENGLMAYEGEQHDSRPPVPEHVLDSSDDDEIYKAVEDIDPSDNDEYIDETLEEKALRKAFKNSSDDESDFGEIDGEGPDVSMLIQNGLIDDDFFTIDDDSVSAFATSYWDDGWPVHNEENGNELNPEDKPTTRRVRFDDQVHTVSDIDSDETSSEDLNSYWPDLFQNDPLVFRASNDPENVLDDAASDSERSYWDWGDDKDKLSDWDDDQDENAESDSESEAGSSGYETDEGDTTDEELPPPPTITTPARIHRDSTSSASSATPKPLPRTRKMLPPKKPNKRKGPMRGFFAVDPKRALAYIDGTGKRMVLIPGRVRDGSSWAVSTASSTANNSPRSQLMNADESEFSDANHQSLSNLMALGGFFGTDLDLALSMSNQWSVMGDDDLIDEDFDEDDDDDDMEDMLDVADFIDFGQSDSEDADETDAPTDGSPTKAHAGHTPAKSAAHEMSEKMLQHFDRGNVTSFRRNQNRYRDIARLPDDPAMRASASRPVRTGASADAIITPMRKKKRAKDPDILQPRASPLARKSGPIAGTFGPRRV
ncbi:hypothetical protein IWX49DRAFT_592261 [Phyllosticta citricarpa]|uniref:Uncharacterized protein n=2 Tax=Phyllosticta TaxID=121621 RepID=A0ABR1MNY0_9PEZI